MVRASYFMYWSSHTSRHEEYIVGIHQDIIPLLGHTVGSNKKRGRINTEAIKRFFGSESFVYNDNGADPKDHFGMHSVHKYINLNVCMYICVFVYWVFWVCSNNYMQQPWLHVLTEYPNSLHAKGICEAWYHISSEASRLHEMPEDEVIYTQLLTLPTSQAGFTPGGKIQKGSVTALITGTLERARHKQMKKA